MFYLFTLTGIDKIVHRICQRAIKIIATAFTSKEKK